LSAGRLELCGEVENAAFARLVFHPDLSAHQVDEAGRNRQSQTGASKFTRGGRIGLPDPNPHAKDPPHSHASRAGHERLDAQIEITTDRTAEPLS
jgi:hypothetical protein